MESERSRMIFGVGFKSTTTLIEAVVNEDTSQVFGFDFIKKISSWQQSINADHKSMERAVLMNVGRRLLVIKILETIADINTRHGQQRVSQIFSGWCFM